MRIKKYHLSKKIPTYLTTAITSSRGRGGTERGISCIRGEGVYSKLGTVRPYGIANIVKYHCVSKMPIACLLTG